MGWKGYLLRWSSPASGQLAGTSVTRLSCSEPHQTWPWMFLEMGHPSPPWINCASVSPQISLQDLYCFTFNGKVLLLLYFDTIGNEMPSSVLVLLKSGSEFLLYDYRWIIEVWTCDMKPRSATKATKLLLILQLSISQVSSLIVLQVFTSKNEEAAVCWLKNYNLFP